VNRRRFHDWSDAFIASDPGLSRLIQALQIALGIGATLAAEYGFAQLAHPLWDSAPAGPRVSHVIAALAAQHHAATLIAMLFGGIIGMIATIGVTEVTWRSQAITMGGLPLPLIATLAAATQLAPHRAIGLVGLSLVMGIGVYVRKFAPRFGPRMVTFGLALFIGYFFGFIAGKLVPTSQIYWVAAILWLAVLVNFSLRIVVFNPLAAGALSRSRRSFAAHTRRVIAETARLLEDGDTAESVERRKRRLAGQLVRLNASAVMIDGQLADLRLGLEPGEAQALHDVLFELELGVENLSRMIGALARRDAGVDPRVAARIRGWLTGVAAGDTADAAAYGQDGASDEAPGTAMATDNVVYAIAAVTVAVGDALGRWQRGELPPVAVGDEVDFATAYESPVMLIGGNLAGSSPSSNAALASGAAGKLAARLHLDAAAVAAIRVMLAVGAASAIGSAVNYHRFYWAVIAVFIIFTGANTAGEQIFKAANRVVGTCIGIVVGSLLAHAVGPSTWSIAVILPALSFGIYFQRVNYALMAAGLTVTLSMLYVDLGEFSNGLLLDRLELTAIGAAIAMLAALLIFPIRTGRVLRQAALQYLDALLALIEGLSSESAAGAPPASLVGAPTASLASGPAASAPDGPAASPPVASGGERGAAPPSKTAARHLDDTLQQLLVTARPLTRDPFRRDQLEDNLQEFVASAQFARNLAAGAGAGAVTSLGAAERTQLTTALISQADRVRGLHDTVEFRAAAPNPEGPGPTGTPILDVGRSLAEQGVPRSDPRRQFLFALFNLDSTLVQLGRQLTDARS
jgi:hypothetical protein